MSVKNINIDELLDLLADEELELIDVREVFEYEDERISGAKNIPMGLVPLKESVIDFSKKVVFYCRSGARSLMVANSIDKDDRDLYNLSGGMIAVEKLAKSLIKE